MSLSLPIRLLACLALFAAFEPVSAGSEPARQNAAAGLDFARAHCSGCHAVVALKLSSNPEAPPFETIVNRPGLTSGTLKAYLRDSHNFPDIMEFDIDAADIDALAAYMLTLRKRR